MSDLAGTYLLGPASAQLTVLTGTSGPAARLGHNLEIVVDQWSATIELVTGGSGSKISLKADAGSLRVVGSRRSLTPVSDGDIRTIEQAIDAKVLKRSTVRFSSSLVTAVDAHHLRVTGTLTLLGSARPVEFGVQLTADGGLSGEATVKQRDWGIKPYAVMGGALKVADSVTVTLVGQLPERS